MVNTSGGDPINLERINLLLRVYLLVAFATVGILAVLSAVAPHEAPRDTWVHAVIVAVFAVLLPLRLRSARGVKLIWKGAVATVAAGSLDARIIERTRNAHQVRFTRDEVLADGDAPSSTEIGRYPGLLNSFTPRGQRRVSGCSERGTLQVVGSSSSD
jgi:hypothetical protein